MMEVQNKELAAFEKTKAIMRSDEVLKRFSDVLGSDFTARRYIGSVLLAVSQSEDLQKCTPQSIMVSGMRAATLKLTVDPGLGHSYLVPFRNKDKYNATLIIGYRGLKQLAMRTGKYLFINEKIVYDGQSIIEDDFSGIQKVTGIPTHHKDGFKPIGYWMGFQLNESMGNFKQTYYMTLEEVVKHAERYARGYNRSDSAWKTNFDDMALKTVIRRGLYKYGFFDENDTLAMAEPEEVYEDEIDSEYVNGELLESGLKQEAQRKEELVGGKSTDELNAMLGFEDEPDTSKKPAPAKKKVEVSIPKQSMKDYEIPASFKSKQAGKIYGDMSIEELQAEIMTLTQYEPKNQEEKVQANDRIQAAKQLIKYIEANPI